MAVFMLGFHALTVLVGGKNAVRVTQSPALLPVRDCGAVDDGSDRPSECTQTNHCYVYRFSNFSDRSVRVFSKPFSRRASGHRRTVASLEVVGRGGKAQNETPPVRVQMRECPVPAPPTEGAVLAGLLIA